jgi:hypothetical protein
MPLDPKALEAARKAVGTIPGAWLWSDIEKAIIAYLSTAGGEPVAWMLTGADGRLSQASGRKSDAVAWAEIGYMVTPLYTHPHHEPVGVKEAIEALTPLAAIADEYSDAEDDEFEVWQDFDVLGATLPLRNFRAARKALRILSALSPHQEAAVPEGYVLVRRRHARRSGRPRPVGVKK